ncbi:hypothetical protein IMY05_C4541000100 [Salix suchowensis]|nr:hypothetical protein IMY05_C4541000100 [Salix suchowensis]
MELGAHRLAGFARLRSLAASPLESDCFEALMVDLGRVSGEAKRRSRSRRTQGRGGEGVGVGTRACTEKPAWTSRGLDLWGASASLLVAAWSEPAAGGVEASTSGAPLPRLSLPGLRAFFGETTTSASASTVPKERRREGTGEGARSELQEQQQRTIERRHTQETWEESHQHLWLPSQKAYGLVQSCGRRAVSNKQGVDKVSIWVGVTQVGQGKETSTHLDALGGIAYKQTEGGRGGSETVGKRRADRSDSFERFAAVDLCTYNCAVGLTLDGRPRRSGETTESRRGGITQTATREGTLTEKGGHGALQETSTARRTQSKEKEGSAIQKKTNRVKKRTKPGNETLQID